MKFTKEMQDSIVAWVTEHGLTPVPFGATKIDLCKVFGIDRKTLDEWLGNSTFSTRIEEAKKIFTATCINRVEASLYDKASGQAKRTRKRTKYAPNASGQPTIVEQVVEEETLPPDVEAQKFILTNRKQEEWKNRQNTDITSGGEKLDLTWEEVRK